MMQADFEHCAALVREADRDRYLATLYAPAARRDALFALYAFAVEIERVREVAREPIPGEIRLQWWREVVAGERVGEAAANPVAAALRQTLTRQGIGADRAIALIDAHAFDLYDEPIPTVDDLDNYAAKTQGALLAMAADILGVSDRTVDALTRHAGIAMVIANLLRGLARHAGRRQLYVPVELLQRHAADHEEIFAGQVGDAHHAVLADLRIHARDHLAAARRLLNDAPPAILPALLPASLVGPTLRRMERSDYDPLQFQPLSGPRRQWLLWRAARDPRRIFGT
jgi:15-cis-phytoene synthase